MNKQVILSLLLCMSAWQAVAGAEEAAPSSEPTVTARSAAEPAATATTAPAAPQKTAEAHAKKPVEDLPNFHEVHPFLYRSGEPTVEGLKKLKEMGVNTLIDLRAPSEQKFDEKEAASELGFKYIRMVMTSAAPTKKQVDTLLSTIKKAEKNPSGGKVLVHCAHGSDRTGCMIGIWRVTQEGWNYDEAYKEMRKYWFTPKFVNLSAAVKKYAENKKGAQKESASTEKTQ